jgi:2-polyprenyl-3-methyl-5-hydroxy-6-metoxy-1,4-benzoquinol methylase
MNVPENMGKYYSNYYSFKFDVKSASNLFKNLIHRLFYNFGICTVKDAVLKQTLKIVPLNYKDRILDIGCGNGSLIYNMRRIGFQNVLGIDPFIEKDIMYANGATVLKKSIFDVDETYDLVMLHHSFEHMPEPRRVMLKIDALLAKFGKCIIRIPNVDSFAFKQYRENWWAIHAPRHFILPSKQGMNALLSGTSLRLINVSCDSNQTLKDPRS